MLVNASEGAKARADDERLVAAARRVIGDNYEHGRHHPGAAVRMREGRVFAGVHVEAYVRRITLCAEAVALGVALSAGARGVETVVAVAHDPQAEGPVVSPCGMRRELISDFGLDAWVIIPSAEGPPRKVAVLDLLAAMYPRAMHRAETSLYRTERRVWEDLPGERGPRRRSALLDAGEPAGAQFVHVIRQELSHVACPSSSGSSW